MSIIDASLSVGRGLEATALPVSLILPGPVSNPQGVSTNSHCLDRIEEIVAPAEAMAPEFQLDRDRHKLTALLEVLRAQAKAADAAFALIESPTTLPICKELHRSSLEVVPGSIYSRQVSEFAVVVRSRGDDIGVSWVQDLFFARPQKPYDSCAARAGVIVGQAFDCLKAEISRRLSQHRLHEASSMPVFEAGGLVGAVSLDPAQLLERVPPSLRAPLKALLQDSSNLSRYEAVKTIEQSPERHSPAVFATLRYAVLHHSRDALAVMARGFPEYKAEVLAFIHCLVESPLICPGLKHTAIHAALFASPELLLPGAAESEFTIRRSDLDCGSIMRHWLSDTARCAALASHVREYFVTAVAESIKPDDITLVQSIAKNWPEFAKVAAAQRKAFRAAQPYEIPAPLRRLGRFVQEQLASLR